MKNITLIIIAVFAFAYTAQSQETPKNAIGLRLGDSDGFGTAISYQRYINERNRLEFDLGWISKSHHDAVKFAGLYQWVWNIDGGFNWYAGPGAGLAQIHYDDHHHKDFDDDNETFLFLAGDVGIEYDFDFPLLISLDFRPEIELGSYNDDVGFNIGLGARYQF